MFINVAMQKRIAIECGVLWIISLWLLTYQFFSELKNKIKLLLTLTFFNF